MAYKKYKPEIKKKINCLMAKRYYYGSVKPSPEDVAFFSNKYGRITEEIESIKSDPNSYDKRAISKKRRVHSIRSYICQAKKKWPHKVKPLEEKLKELLKAG
jgi:hypothetical protein